MPMKYEPVPAMNHSSISSCPRRGDPGGGVVEGLVKHSARCCYSRRPANRSKGPGMWAGATADGYHLVKRLSKTSMVLSQLYLRRMLRFSGTSLTAIICYLFTIIYTNNNISVMSLHYHTHLAKRLKMVFHVSCHTIQCTKMTHGKIP